ncbi:DEAD-box ATP-dependent RNA helicase 31-like isoform X2 [Telopea speciosissima]|uniref:DEAD-box ATP-dependent RNA helicase 31-like isoform X2 n=1 Tax=Telopea speciosissima TaxID=54955 RepID=UPI001CC559D0|nr:DEAD-box ATP-dependent RNA helicase 31-like isoform X2 [Telopea speciosissima]
MLGRLLLLRLLNASVSSRGFSFMRREATSFPSSRGTSFLSRVFPFRLKYALQNDHFKVRGFSRRSFSPRNGGTSSAPWVSELSHSSRVERREFQTGSSGGRGGQAKSLVEDEAELSDWISELKTDSFRVGFTSESEDDSDTGRNRSRIRDKGRVSFSSPKNERRGKGGVLSAKRPIDSDSDDFTVTNRRSSRSMTGSRSKRLIRSESEEDESEAFSSEAKKGGRDSNLSFGKGQRDRNLQRGGESSRRAVTMSEDEDEDLRYSIEDLPSEEDNDKDLSKSANSLTGFAKEVNVQPMPRSTTGKTDSYLSQTRFDQCSLSPLSLKGIKDAGYERMTEVQEATLPVILKGKDVLAKAKTGTGKTVAFLLPAIEVVVKSPPVDRDQKRPPILVLVICPTRELANQAAAEANTLLKYHPSIGVQVVIGGTRLPLEQKRMKASPCQILVATPGRLRDHIGNTAGFATRLMGVKVLVLDEADHLLDMGFRKDIERIIAAVPKQRQTLLFSATVPEEVRQICHIALKRDHEFINTVEEGSEETHSQVRQMHLVAPLDKHFSLLYVLLKEHISEDVDYKVLVFCTTTMVTKLVADLLSELNLNVREIHSRKPQSYRTRVSDEFRKSKGLILVTSDVSARGVDYPDVTLVIQLGVPSDREQYIHRLGRTGRKGKEGQGILLLAPWEDFFLSSVKDLPIEKAPIPSVDPDTRKKVEKALSHVEMKNKEAAYQAWLGYYNSNKNVGRDKCRLVELANEFSRSMGLDNPPAIPKLVLGKMGLKNVRGLRSR